MSEAIVMPKFGMTMSEGLIVSWEKAVGDRVEKGDIILKIESDKALMDVEATRSGYLVQIVANPDDVVECGKPVGYIADHPQR